MTWWDEAAGRTATVRRTFTADDLTRYRRLTADRDTGFVPEPLLAALFSQLLGTELPGPESIYLRQSLRFSRQIEVGANVLAQVRITGTRPAKALVDLSTVLTVDGDVVCRGEALVLARQFPSPPKENRE